MKLGLIGGAHGMDKPSLTVGWREWVSLPDLNLPWLKARIDSGKRTSILNTFIIEPFERDGNAMVRFGVHPHQHSADLAVLCEAPIAKIFEDISIDGEKETHYVIETMLHIGQQYWPIELVLNNQENINFRLLLGHTAINGHLLVDPSDSYLLGTPTNEEIDALYE